jgi:tRNA dimethylallyltransferase
VKLCPELSVLSRTYTHVAPFPPSVAGFFASAHRHPLLADVPVCAPGVVGAVGLPTQDAKAPLVAIVGPTASGKSALGLAVAREFGGEIVSVDSVQVYRGFDIGTAKPSRAERAEVPHHLLDFLEPDQVFTAGDFRREGLRVLADLRSRGRLPVLVGGTGLYLRALLMGLFEGPKRCEALRTRLRQVAARRGPDFLHHLLARLDPAAAARIHPRDHQKLIRAIEVCWTAGRPISALFQQGRKPLQGFRVLTLGLNPDRNQLRQRIERRVERMFACGLLEETRAALARPDAGRLKPLQALGYAQACAALRGEVSVGEAIRLAQAATRRYAKRQMTWFRREPGVYWIAGFGDTPEVQRQAITWLRAQGM